MSACKPCQLSCRDDCPDVCDCLTLKPHMERGEVYVEGDRRHVFQFLLEVENCCGAAIDHAQVHLDLSNSILNSGTCEFVDTVSDVQVEVSTGSANVAPASLAPYTGFAVKSLLLRTVSLAPGTNSFSVSFYVEADEELSLSAPLWSLGGNIKCCDGTCIPVHRSAVAAIDCLPNGVYDP